MTTPTFQALLIGVDHYPAVNAPLSGCVNDALEIRRFLLDCVHVPEPAIRLLLAPRPGRSAPLVPPADSHHIRAAFADLTAAVRPGEHVIVYFAGHGVRVDNQVTKERVYGFAPTDTAFRLGGGYQNLVLDCELNAFLRGLTAAGATVTLIADTCHSGGGFREALTVRSLLHPPLRPDAWETFLAAQPAPREPLPARALGAGSGWFDPAGARNDWVVFSACLDTELAKEDVMQKPGPDGTTVDESHGLFTVALLEALARVPAGALLGHRWMDLGPSVFEAVAARVKKLVCSAQTPTLEGRPEQLVFGGAWTPFAPGFTACRGPGEGLITLDAGSLHGLDAGAEVAVYPPGIAYFEAAEAGGVCLVRARVETASPATSTARLLDPAAAIAEGSRARLVRPSPSFAPIGVALTGVPESVAAGISRARGAAELLAVTPGNGPFDVEVLPWKAAIPSWGAHQNPPVWAGALGGWVIVPYSPERREPAPDDVIAYLPPLAAPGVAGNAARLGEGLGRALVHWARYLHIVKRTHAEPALAAIIQVALRVGRDKETAVRRAPDAAGAYEITEGEAVWVEIVVKAALRQRLFAGILVCSNDGNVMIAWPEEGADPALSAQTLLVGRDRFQPAELQVRRDQTSSLYTFKVIATTKPDGAAPVRLASLSLETTAQDEIEERPVNVRGAMRAPAPVAPPLPATPLWSTWDLPVRVRRAR
jgi:hypothetical protein